MIVVFSIGESFNRLQGATALQRNCRAFAEAFPSGVRTEFFDYLKATDPNRYFIIRSDTKDRDNFVNQANIFAKNLEFTILGKFDAEDVLKRIDLNSFV